MQHHIIKSFVNDMQSARIAFFIYMIQHPNVFFVDYYFFIIFANTNKNVIFL